MSALRLSPTTVRWVKSFIHATEWPEGLFMDKQPAKRGPKPLHGENMAAFHFRMTQAQRDKLAALGGAKWVREQIDKAPI